MAESILYRRETIDEWGMGNNDMRVNSIYQAEVTDGLTSDDESSEITVTCSPGSIRHGCSMLLRREGWEPMENLPQSTKKFLPST